MKKVYLKTFGCQMNEHDSAKMYLLLNEKGYTKTDEMREADLVIFNTCTVRERPHHKAISEVGRALKLKKRRPHMIVAIAGCVAQEEKDNLFRIYPELDLVIGPDQIWRIAELVEKHGSRSFATELVNEYDDYRFIVGGNVESKVCSFVTIMKGCNNFCTFCIVPYVRGREVSKTPEDIISEVKELTESGVKEITLLGQNVNSYRAMGRSSDRPIARSNHCTDFVKLLQRISSETDILRIRYSSPHPKDFSDDLILEHMTNKKLCEQVHLPLQAGSTEVLKRMNRKYTKDDYLKLAQGIRSRVQGVNITTDIIVGFPGETDQDFEDTLDVMKQVEFDGMFAFKYSPRPGTKADEKFADDVAKDVKVARLDEILKLNEKIVLKKHEKYVETTQEVLVEGKNEKREGQLTGRTRTGKIVNFESTKDLTGKLVNIKIDWAGLNSLRGKII